MIFEELEEALDEILPPGFSIEINKHGQIIILTNLRRDEDGELHQISGDDVDEDFDPDLDSLDDIEDDDE
jgi:hypothetical protein